MKILIPVLIFLTISIGISSALPTDEGPIEVTVKEKWTKVISDGESVSGVYLFSTTNGNVYSIQDTLWHWNFNAADRYALIQPNNTYKIWLFGIRMPFFSAYQNAYRIEKI